MELTLATLQDEQLAYDFVCELEEQDFSREVFHNTWIKSMEDDTIQHYFLKVDNDFVGFCSLRRIYHLHHCAKVAQIEEFIVRKEYRRLGYASKMFSYVKEMALKESCIMIELSSSNKRVQAHAFYESQGMKARHLKFTYLFK